MVATNKVLPVKAVLFDFGGVLAEEGFRRGFDAFAAQNGLDPGFLYELATEAVYKSGYITGRANEADFWRMIHKRSGMQAKADKEYTEEILKQFTLRPKMITVARTLKSFGLITAILSDQTDWLDRLEARDHFFSKFDHIFNSYHIGKSKRDLTIFEDVIDALKIAPGEALFIDNDSDNIARADLCGLRTILYHDYDYFIEQLNAILGFRAA